MRTATAPLRPEERARRFSDEMFNVAWPHPEPKPGQSREAAPERCPLCDQPLRQTRTSIGAVFTGGVRRLVIAIWMIASSLLRCIRLMVATAFCLVGLIGSCFRTLGLRIAHPHDRRFFSRRGPY